MSTNLPIPIHADKAWIDDIRDKLDKGEITTEQWDQIKQFFEENQFGPVSPSIICKGQECVYAEACPILRAKLPAPLGLPCPIEETSKHLWFKSLRREMGVAEDGFEAVDLGAACDIINLMIQKQRVQWEMVTCPHVAERIVKGFDMDGTPLIEIRPNPTFYALKALNLMQLKISESLMTTREARSKDESRKTSDAAVKFAALTNLTDRLKGIRSERNPDGSPVSVAELVARLEETKTADETLNIENDDAEGETNGAEKGTEQQ